MKELTILFLALIPVGALAIRHQFDAKILGPLVFVILAWLLAFVFIRAIVTRVFVTTRTTSLRDKSPWKYWYMCSLILVLYAGSIAGVVLVGR